MNILVLIKQVPDTESEIKLNDSKTGIEKDELELILNPNDEFAVEEALRVREKFGGEVTAISLGPNAVESALRTCLKMGADKAVHFAFENVNCLDTFQTALIMANAIKDLPYDIIFCGNKAIDTDNGAIGIQLAEILGIPHIASITKLKIDDGGSKAVVFRQAGESEEVIECGIPALFTCQKGLNEPRRIKLPDIMKAKKKPFEKKEIDNVAARTVEILGIKFPPQRESGRMLEGTEEARVKELVAILKQKSKGGQ